MPLGRRFVIAPALWKGETVMDVRMDLQLSPVPGGLEELTQVLNHVQRRQLVMLGAGDVQLPLGLAQRQVRAFLVLADQPGAVEGRGGANAIAPCLRRNARSQTFRRLLRNP